jgi:cis-3-alkyl-4-acyloxetan-2-one decarboxylase
MNVAAEPVFGASASSWRALYPFTSHHLRLDGHSLHYLDEGPRDAPCVLLLHGNPTWSFYWRELVRGLRGSFRVVAPDHLGCGLSDKPQSWPYRLSGHVDNVERLVGELDLRDLTLGVHDWGGAIGMGFAARRPERVRRFVVLNTAAFRSRALPLRIAVCRVPGLGALAVRGLNAFARAALLMATERGLTAAVREGYLAPYDSWRNRVALLRFVEDIPLEPGHPSWPTLVQVEEALETLRDRPMLIVWGERDWCFTPAFREEWQRRFPDAQVQVFADAGHYVLEDAGDRAVTVIRDFLTGTRSGTQGT